MPLPRDEIELGGGLKSVLTALDLLDCFASDAELGVSELSRRLGVGKSTVHRLLTTLCARDLTVRDETTGRYRLGLRLFELGDLAMGRCAIRNAAVPWLQELHARTGYTSHVAIADKTEVLYLDRVVARDATALWSHVPRRQPFAATSSGRVISAFNEDHHHEVRKQGFALSTGSPVPGLTSVAAPLLSCDGRAYAAISLAGPTASMAAELQRSVRLLQEVARRLSRELCL